MLLDWTDHDKMENIHLYASQLIRQNCKYLENNVWIERKPLLLFVFLMPQAVHRAGT